MYRQSYVPPPKVDCPRCGKELAPLDVAPCTCGTWLSPVAAAACLSEADRKKDGLTQWWRKLATCPLCAQTMTLRGTEPGLLLGCDGHGFWIDADTIAHTGLAAGVDATRLDSLRGQVETRPAEPRPAALRRRTTKPPPPPPPPPSPPPPPPHRRRAEPDLAQRLTSMEQRIETLEAAVELLLEQYRHT